MSLNCVYAVAQEAHVTDSSDPDDVDIPASPPTGQVEIDICADSPLRIETTPDGGLHITCYRLDGRQQMVAMLLRFTPGAAANLIGGLYRAVQDGEVSLGEDEPPSH
jgi:hypothetical protein